MSKLNETEIALLSTILSVQKIKDKNLKEECQETMDKYLKIRDILIEFNISEASAKSKRG